jgi:cysteine desulfurase/selenocysteine lyase
MLRAMDNRRALLERFSTDFLGLDRVDPVHTEEGPTSERRRVYLDTTATSLMPGVVWRGLTTYLEAACANSHTDAHRAGRDTTAAIEDSRDAIGRLVGYDPERDVVLFTANGATGAINFLARALFPPELRSIIKRFGGEAPGAFVAALRTELGPTGAHVIDELMQRPLVVTSKMEHHSNLLPWMEAVGHHHMRAVEVHPTDGTLDLADLERLMALEGHRVRLISISGVSNVTGIHNSVHAIARIAHRHGAQILVDGAQWVPHGPVHMHPGPKAEELDYLVLSGHKMYAPGSRGALIGCLETLSARRCVSDVGGGMVEYVSIDDFEIKEQVIAREEAGTPNIPGSIAMGLVAEALMQVGMDEIEARERKLTELLLQRLLRIEGVRVYGSTDLDRVPRAGVVSFNVLGLDHGLVAAWLNDVHNIAVRDGCFCAHPYIKALMQIDDATEAAFRRDLSDGDRRSVPGMVRASLGVYSTVDDIEDLSQALEALWASREAVMAAYEVARDGTWHRIGVAPLPATFRVADEVAAWAAAPITPTS